LHFLDRVLNAQTRGPVNFPCDVNVAKGEELGWFEHGSTIIILATGDFTFSEGIAEGTRIRAGQALLKRK
jgi:phosphatidylserine decarboxylase